MTLWIKTEDLELKMSGENKADAEELFTYLDVQIKTDDFYFSEKMNVYADDVTEFFGEIADICAELKGGAYIEEPYGNQMYMEFVCDKTGHISIEGSLQKNSGENTFVTYFTGRADQSAVDIS